MTARYRLAWIFDVDGTLLLTEGAAREAFARAVHDRLGVEDELRDIAFAGRTEPLILADILARHRVSLDAEGEARFWDCVFSRIRERLTPGRGRVLAGVHALLDALAREPEWIVGLLTGNMTQMARIKLGHFGLRDRFAFGAFGEEASDRNALARALAGRIESDYALPPASCVVVGDTEHDIECARTAGMKVIAVATGFRSLEQLAPHRPDLLLESLEDRERVVAWARAMESKTRPE